MIVHGSGKKSSGDNSSGSDYSEILVSVRRVAKVVNGGRRFSFSVLVVVGDGKGRVGCGLGKHAEVSDARIKAVNSAKKNMFRVHLRESRTLHHDVKSKFCSGRVVLRAARPGTGVIAGGSMRSVFEVLGVQDVVAKSIGPSGSHTVVHALFKALSSIQSPRHIAAKRGKRVSEIIEKR